MRTRTRAEKANASIGKRIQEMREQFGWSQQQLAEALELRHAQIVSDLEAGKRSLKAPELAKLSGIFSVSPIELLSDNLPSREQSVVWRDGGGEAGTGKRKQEEAIFRSRYEKFAFLEKLLEQPTCKPIPQFQLSLKQTSFEDVEKWAEQVRATLGLGETPALGLQQALENQWGVKIFFSPLQGGSAATTRGVAGNAILVNSDEPPWRRRYSLAHELFHLLTWDAMLKQPISGSEKIAKRNETLAEVFASRLLIPVSAIEYRISKAKAKGLKWFDLVVLSREFGVSTLALLWRLVNLNILSKDAPQQFQEDPKLTELDRTFQRESQTEPPRLPMTFAHMAYRAYLDEKISIGKLADLLESTVGLLPKRLSAYGLMLDTHVYKASIISA